MYTEPPRVSVAACSKPALPHQLPSYPEENRPKHARRVALFPNMLSSEHAAGMSEFPWT